MAADADNNEDFKNHIAKINHKLKAATDEAAFKEAVESLSISDFPHLSLEAIRKIVMDPIF
jgi:hypothetical protein